MIKRRIFITLLTIVLIFSLPACSSSNSESSFSDEDNKNISIPSDNAFTENSSGVIPTGVKLSQDEMNNYIQHNSGFAHDSSHIYFADMYYRYTFSPDSKELHRELRSASEGYYNGIIPEGWRFYSEVELDGTLEKIRPNSTVLPCGEYIYYLYDPSFMESEDAIIFRAPINKVEETDETSSINGKEFKCLKICDSEIVFQEEGLSSFGIYGNHIVATTESCDYWVVNIDTCEGQLIISGDEIQTYYGSKSFAVDGDYIYFTNDVEPRIERIQFDGTGRETFLEGMNGSFRELFCISGGYLYHVDNNENGESCLYRTNLFDVSDQIVLATGASQGISVASEPFPYVAEDWVYYGSISYGYWRAKTNGSQTELITYAAYSETEPQWDVEAFEKHNIAAGYEHTVAIRSDGTVVATGKNDEGQCDVSDWTDIVSVYAAQGKTVGIKSDGTFCAAGSLPVVYGLTNSIAYDLRFGATLAVKSNGSVVGDCTLGGGAPNGWTSQVETWTGIIAAATSAEHTIGLKNDGTVIAAGDNSDGQCDVYNWTDIIAVAVGSDFSIGLKSDGTVITAGDIQELNWSDIVSVSAVNHNVIGLKRDGTVVTNNKNLSDWTNIVEVCAGGRHYVGICSDGTVLSSGENAYKQCNTGEWNNIRTSK